MARGELARLVRQAMDADPAAMEIVSRGALNLRAFARWLIEANGWSGSEEAVVSALRRVEADAKDDALSSARDVLRQGHVNMRASLCSAALPNSREVQRRLMALFGTIDTSRGEALRIVSSDQGFKVILDEKDLDRIADLFGGQSVKSAKRDLTELSIVLPPTSQSTPGILALVTSTLARRRINIEEIVDSVGQHKILVAKRDALAAYEAINALLSPPAQVVERPGPAKRRGRPRRAT